MEKRGAVGSVGVRVERGEAAGFWFPREKKEKQKLREVAVWLEPAGEEEEEKIQWVSLAGERQQ